MFITRHSKVACVYSGVVEVWFQMICGTIGGVQCNGTKVPEHAPQVRDVCMIITTMQSICGLSCIADMSYG